MIRRIRIRGFKRFAEIDFRLPRHVVLAGPNNTGKTTLLQAVAAWSLAFRNWRRLNDFNRRQGYTRAPVARQAFSAVPLRSFELLWNPRAGFAPMEIELQHDAGWTICMELVWDSTEQIYVRPRADVSAETLRATELTTVFVPPMTGLGTDEPLLQPPKIDQLLGLGRPGEVLRNLLVEANANEAAWRALQASITRLFGYELLPPDASGPDIVAVYRESPDSPPFDIASAGSGFQQVLMLLTFLNTRAGAVLLLDEPDAHLHVILQDAIYRELRGVAAQQRSQLIIATHSEVIINNVDPRELCVTLKEPRMVADRAERRQLAESLRVLSNTDIMQAVDVAGVLYVEDYTDMDILRAWAERLGHPALELLTTRVMWKPVVFQSQENSPGIRSADHYSAMQLVKQDLPGLELRDGDARPAIEDSEITGQGLQRIRWRRYEIESYLLHPGALTRFVERQVGEAGARPHVEDMLTHFRKEYPPGVVDDPLGDHEFLNNTKARTKLLPPLLEAAGIHDLPYTRYHEIGALMEPEEIHPEVREKLDAICRAFGVAP